MSEPTDDKIPELEEMVADDPEDTLARYLLATEYLKAARPADAAAAFQAVVDLDDGYSAAWGGLGAAWEAAGDADAARAAWRSAAACADRKGDHVVLRNAKAALVRLGG